VSHVVFIGADNIIYYTHQIGSEGVAPEKWKGAGEFSLEQNYPNPFNPRTTIKYTLMRRTQVEFQAFDILGREVLHYQLGYQEPGEHSFVFDAIGLSSGAYFYQVQTEQGVITRKMTVVK
jgi:hypothetical protein